MVSFTAMLIGVASAEDTNASLTADMNDSNYRDKIVRLEAEAEELADSIESCHKFILAGRVAIVTGGLVLLATMLGLIGSSPVVLGASAAAVLGGIVAAGSNRSTAKESAMQLIAIEAERAELISRLDLRDVSEGQPRE